MAKYVNLKNDFASGAKAKKEFLEIFNKNFQNIKLENDGDSKYFRTEKNHKLVKFFTDYSSTETKNIFFEIEEKYEGQPQATPSGCGRALNDSVPLLIFRMGKTDEYFFVSTAALFKYFLDNPPKKTTVKRRHAGQDYTTFGYAISIAWLKSNLVLVGGHFAILKKN